MGRCHDRLHDTAVPRLRLEDVARAEYGMPDPYVMRDDRHYAGCLIDEDLLR